MIMQYKKHYFLMLIIMIMAMTVNVAVAHDIEVKYRADSVDVSQGDFEEYCLKPSSMVKALFYDAANAYAIVGLKKNLYHYCGIPQAKITDWVASASLGRFYLKQIKGQYDCRLHPVPEY